MKNVGGEDLEEEELLIRGEGRERAMNGPTEVIRLSVDFREGIVQRR